MLSLRPLSTFALTSQTLQPSLFEVVSKKTKGVETTLDNIRKKYGFWSIVPGILIKRKTTAKSSAKVH